MDNTPFENWSRNDGELLRTSLSQNSYSKVPVVEACEQAIERLDDSAVSEEQHVIPLFEADAPRPTDEYIYYKPESEEVKIRDKGLTWHPLDEVATTRLGQRLRWWLPDSELEINVLEDDQIPPEAITPASRLSEDETSAFFDEMRELVTLERNAAKETNREQYETLGFESAIQRGVMAGPLIPIGTESYRGSRAYKFQLVAAEDTGEDTEPNLRDDADIFPENEYIVGVRGYAGLEPIEMEAVYVGDTDLWLSSLDGKISPNSPRDEALTDDEVTVWLHQLLNPVPFDRRLNAITQATGPAEAGTSEW